MRVRLDYGSDGLEVNLPSDRVTVIQPAFRSAVADPHAALSAALRAPLGRPPLREIVRPGQKIAISVCDITRAQPRQAMLEALFAELPDIRPEDVTILIATGTHRVNTPAEHEQMLGADIARRYRVVNHDSRAASTLVHVGTTTTGVPVSLNRIWMDADIRITTGFVEPHFFAGFSGGPKLVTPGLAGLDTVLVLHDATRIGDPKATWGITHGNPVHDDIRAAANAAPPHFAFDVILNREQKVIEAFAGELEPMHAAACQAAQKFAMRAVPEPFDVVVTSNSGYPLDQNLYQAVKGMSAAAKVVKPGGLIICAAECRDGFPGHGSYRELLGGDPREFLRTIMQSDHATPDQWQVQIQANIQDHARIVMHTGHLSDDELRSVHLEQTRDIGATVAAEGGSASVCVLPEGPQTIAYIG